MFGHKQKQRQNPMTWGKDEQEPQVYKKRVCSLCNGTRKVETTRLDDETGKLITVKDYCPSCGGTGEA